MNAYIKLLSLTVFAMAIAISVNCCQGQIMGYDDDSYCSYPYVNNRALTPGEAYARGLSDVIRAQGAYNLMNSKAAINDTEAIRNDIQNRELWTNTYFQMRKENRIARAEEAGPRPTVEELVRYAQMGKPKPLNPSQLDAVTGKINWPRPLRTDEFAALRNQLDDLFAKRARYGDISMEDFMWIRDLTDQMMNRLKEQIQDIPISEYTAAKQFLISLAYEIRRSAG
jgi:hypothetical protein